MLINLDKLSTACAFDAVYAKTLYQSDIFLGHSLFDLLFHNADIIEQLNPHMSGVLAVRLSKCAFSKSGYEIAHGLVPAVVIIRSQSCAI